MAEKFSQNPSLGKIYFRNNPCRRVGNGENKQYMVDLHLLPYNETQLNQSYALPKRFSTGLGSKNSKVSGAYLKHPSNAGPNRLKTGLEASKQDLAS